MARSMLRLSGLSLPLDHPPEAIAPAICARLGYVRGPGAQHSHEGTPALVELWGVPVPVKLFDRWPVRPRPSA